MGLYYLAYGQTLPSPYALSKHSHKNYTNPPETG